MIIPDIRIPHTSNELLPLAVSQRKIGRPEGFLLLFGYSAYMAWRFFMTGGVQP